MEELFSLEKSVIDDNGKLFHLQISEIENNEAIMNYRCVINGEKEIFLSVDENGDWVDSQSGVTKLSLIIGNIIEDNFE